MLDYLPVWISGLISLILMSYVDIVIMEYFVTDWSVLKKKVFGLFNAKWFYWSTITFLGTVPIVIAGYLLGLNIFFCAAIMTFLYTWQDHTYYILMLKNPFVSKTGKPFYFTGVGSHFKVVVPKLLLAGFFSSLGLLF